MNSPFKTPWHFDNFKEDKEGEYVKIVGRFTGEWSDELTLLRSGLSDLFFGKEYNTQGYNHAANAPSENHSKEDAILGDSNANKKYIKYVDEYWLDTEVNKATDESINDI